MATLDDILQLLPDVGRTRLAFNPSFWPRAANGLLSIIESEARGPDLYMEAFIPFNGRQTMFQIPAAMRKLLRVRAPDGYSMLDINDTRTELLYYPREGGFIQLAVPPGIAPVKAQVTQQYEDSLMVRPAPGSPISDPVGEGWAAIVTHASGAVEYRRVLSKSDDGLSVSLDGPTKAPIAAGDTSLLVDRYMIFEGQRKLTRFVDENSLSPLPDEWNRILEAGLRWKLEAQSDEDGSSEASSQWFQQFRDAMEAYAGDMAERPGDQNRVKPRAGSHWSILE